MKNHLLKVMAVFVMALLLLGANAQNKKVVYLIDPSKAADTNTGTHPEFTVGNFVETVGCDVHYLKQPQLLNCTVEQLDSLKDADLIIIGRGISSFNFAAHNDSIWNLLRTPVLSLSMFAVRNGQLKWFDSGTVDFGAGAASGAKRVKMDVPNDPVFSEVVKLEGDSLDFWEGSGNALNAGPAGSEQILLSYIGADAIKRIVYARFNPNVEFYPLPPQGYTDHIPRGYRSFIGMGADSSGGNPYNYFGFTFDGQDILKKEILRLLAFEKPGVGIKKVNASIANVYVNKGAGQVVVEMAKLSEVKIMDITGKVVAAQKAKGLDTKVNINNLKTGIYLVKAIDSNNNSVVKKIMVK